MLHRTGRLITALAATTTAATTTFVLASSAPALAVAANEVPFKGHYAGVLDPPNGPTPETPTETLTGSGNATYLGASTNLGHGNIIGPASCQGGSEVQSDQVLTSTDDGDQVMLTTHTEDCPVSPGVFKAVGTFTVTGGTRRFADAHGSGSFTGSPDLNRGTFEFSFDGTISRPKAS